MPTFSALSWWAKSLLVTFSVIGLIVLGVAIGVVTRSPEQPPAVVPATSVSPRSATPGPTTAAAPPVSLTPLLRFAQSRGLKPITEEVVFVTRGVYGGDLEYRAILRGKIRNVSTRPHRDVWIVWLIYNDLGEPMDVYNAAAEKGQLAAFSDKVEYLDAKAEADFTVTIDLHAGLGAPSADAVRRAIRDGRQDAGIFEMLGKP